VRIPLRWSPAIISGLNRIRFNLESLIFLYSGSFNSINNKIYLENSSIGKLIKQELVYNLSSKPLDEQTKSVLSKGLSFIPTPVTLSYTKLCSQHSNFVRKIKIKDYFDHFPPFKEGLNLVG